MALTKNQLHQLVLDNLPSNVTQFISPELLREVEDSIIDSVFLIVDDANRVALTEYDPTRAYTDESGVFYSGDLYQADVAGSTTPGAFLPSEWSLIDSTSATTANYILKDNGIELDAGKKVVLVATDASIETLTTGLYEVEASLVDVGLVENYPVLGKSNYQMFEGSSASRSMAICRPYATPSIYYVRTLTSSWTKVDVTALALTYVNGVQKIGSEIGLGGLYDGVTLSPNTAASEFSIDGSNVAGIFRVDVKDSFIKGNTTISKDNNFVSVGASSVWISSQSEVDIFNLKPSNIATYKQNYYGSGLTTADQNIPDWGLVSRFVDAQMDAIAVGATYANGLSSNVDIITSAVTVGLGGGLSEITEINLSGFSLHLNGQETDFAVNPTDIIASKTNESFDSSTRLEVNADHAALISSNSAQTADSGSVKVTNGGAVNITGPLVHNGTSAILSNSLTQLNSADVRLTTIPSGTTAVSKQVVIKDNVTGALTTIEADQISPDTSTIVEGSENINVLNTGTTNYQVVLNDDPDVNSLVVADAIYHKSDVDTRVEFETNRINMVGGNNVNIAQFGFGSQAVFNPDSIGVDTFFYGSGGSGSIAASIAGDANYFQIGTEGYNGAVDGAHLRLAQSTAQKAQISFYTNSNTEVTSPSEGDCWYSNGEFSFFDGFTVHNLLSTGAGSGSTTNKVTFKAVSDTLTEDDSGVVIATAAITLTLPTTDPVQGATFKIKDSTGNASAANIIISGGTYTMDGQATKNITEDYGALTFVFDGTNYIIL